MSDKGLTSSYHHTFLWDSRCLTAVDPSCPISTPPQTLCMAHKDWLWPQTATLWWQTLGTIVLKYTVIFNSTLISKNKYLHLFLKAATLVPNGTLILHWRCVVVASFVTPSPWTEDHTLYPDRGSLVLQYKGIAHPKIPILSFSLRLFQTNMNSCGM